MIPTLPKTRRRLQPTPIEPQGRKTNLSPVVAWAQAQAWAVDLAAAWVAELAAAWVAELVAAWVAELVPVGDRPGARTY